MNICDVSTDFGAPGQDTRFEEAEFLYTAIEEGTQIVLYTAIEEGTQIVLYTAIEGGTQIALYCVVRFYDTNDHVRVHPSRVHNVRPA